MATSGVRPQGDYLVDRPGVEAQQWVELTGTNRPSGLTTENSLTEGEEGPCPLCDLEGFIKRKEDVSGDHGGGETPVPIPNTEVKPSSADGTAPT